jgi:hypothetical protein
MQPADDGGSARSSRLRRYGPLAVIVVLLLVVGAVLLVGGGDDEEGEASSGAGALEWSSIGDAEPGAPAPTGRMPLTYAEAEEQDVLDEHEWSDSCDTERGTVKMPSVYAPPCVPAFDGDNGGATSAGVTGDSIKVVYYAPETSADLQSILGGMGVQDTAEQRVATLEQYTEIFSSVVEMYGREIELVRFAASGAASDVVASQADATDVIAMEPFAVIGGPGLDRGTFAQEISDAGILCYGCAGVLPDDMIRDMAPYVWSTAPSVDQALEMLQSWTEAGAESGITDEVAFAGGDLTGEPRKSGVIHFEQDPPIFSGTTEEQADRYEGMEVALIESYILDLPNMPAKAAELIAQFKAEGINSIVFMGDPFMPGYLTDAATAQEYYPEWIFTGTALTDSNVFAREWDPAQMEHAYGISQLAAPADQDLEGALAIYRWYFGDPEALPPGENSYSLIAPPVSWLLRGIHMAGPDLTPETFARGQFRVPPGGGGPTNPQVSYGNWGIFSEIDYNGVDDAVEIWWDPTFEGDDGRGRIGTGVWRRSNGAERFTPGDAPEPRPFVEEDTVTVVEGELPAEDQPPDYPPPAGSPAAGG